MSDRVCQDGKSTVDVKVRHEDGGIGVREEGREEMLDVVAGMKGEVVEGVRSALREVLMVSSMAERDRRRKSRRVRSLNCCSTLARAASPEVF
jgi:ribosomal protein L20